MVGTGLGDGLGVTDGDADGLTEGLVLAESLGEAVAVAEALVEGEDGGSAAEGEPDVQAEIAAEASMAKMPQPTAANHPLGRVPALVCTFMEPPHASGRWRPRFPVPHQKPPWEGETRGRPGRGPGRLKASPRKRRGP